MLATEVRPQYQTAMSAEKLYRLERSKEETDGLVLREIRCPYCGFLIDRVFSDAVGHKMIVCRKCKREYPINLGYFRKRKRWQYYNGSSNRRKLR